ncbi:MAG: BMP family lipoprotein [Capsulimonadaceae bacterium]
MRNASPHKKWLFLLMTAAALVIAGCGTSKQASTGGGGPKPFRAGLAVDIAGVDDKSFNAASWRGLQHAQADLNLGPDGVRYIEAKTPSDYQTILADFASQGYNVVFAGSYDYEDALATLAPQFPKTYFAIVDGNAPNLPNTEALHFREEQSSYLAGYLAGSVTRTKTIGFVGGMTIPLIRKFEAGFRAGAKTANPAVRVVSAYTGDWNDVSKGKTQAAQEFASGADIVFQAAGKSGLGVIQAAVEKGAGYYAIGVDSDQDGIAPGRVLTSVLKRVDVATCDTVKRVKAGTFTSGTITYDLKSGGVGLTDMKYTRKDVPPAVLARLKKLTALVADGKVVPPTRIEDVAAFQAPKL